MNMFTVASPAIKLLFERVGRPEVHHRPDMLEPGGRGAVIVCNHAGWADSLWMSYAVYPRRLRHMSKRELFSSPLASWILEQSGSIPIDRGDPSPSTIKSVVQLLRNGELLLIFPAGTRQENARFKRGAATIALHAQVPIVPARYEGPKGVEVTHLLGRPRICVTFGAPIPTAGLSVQRAVASALTERLQASIENLRPTSCGEPHAA
jgi:1-acyl-sn-glycerol-3-phosphate acyltransferase